MTNYISGDYRYKYEPGSGVAAIEAIDKTKTSYGTIQSPISIEGQSYVVTDMSYCFEGCAKMTACPSIPDTVTNLAHCFNGCLNLARITALPTGVTNMISCFESCSSLVKVPELPQTVTEVHDCFWGCTSLVEAPNVAAIAATDVSYLFCNCTSLKSGPDSFPIELPPNGTNMEACFFGCESLVKAPVIFDQYDNIMYGFYGCTSLKGGLYVASNPTYYTNIFGETVEDICIIDWSAEDDSIWPDLVGGNIFYEKDVAGNLTVYSDYIYNSADNSIYVYNKNKTVYDSFDVVERTFTSLENCFKDCINLQSVINIPDGITNLKNCFSGCTSVGGTMQVPNNITAANVSGIFDDTVEDIYLWYYGDSTVWHTVADLYSNVHIELPSDGFDEGDYHYTFEDNYTLSCYAIDKTKTTYGAFTITFAINGYTYTTTDLSNCFDNCKSMISSPVIPSTITNIDECYKNCESLAGNITVSTYSLNSADNVFVGTARPIFIIRSDSSGSPTSWRAVASQFSNVHFETDDVGSPKVEAITLQIGVGTGDTWYYDSEGHSLQVKVSITVDTNNLPVGYTNGLENNAPVIKIEDVVYASTDWSKINNIYTGYVAITDSIKEKTRTVTVEATDLYGNSHSNTAQLESIFVMLDFKDGGKGMAIGRVATRNGLTIQIPTAIGNGLKPPTTASGDVDLNNFQLVIGNYNEEIADADFVVGSGTGNNSRRNSFVVKGGGIYCYDEIKTPVMAINTANNYPTREEFERDDIDGNYNTTITNITLPTSGEIRYYLTYINIGHYVLTEDTEAIEGKTYYSKSENVYTPVTDLEPTDNPQELGLYELMVIPNTTNDITHSYSTFNTPTYFDLTAGTSAVSIGTLTVTPNLNSINLTISFDTSYVIFYNLNVNYPVINENYVSYAFGKYLNVNQELQFVTGIYNKNNALNVLEIGNGTSDSARSNALTVDWSGNTDIAGKLRPMGNTQRTGVSYIAGARGDAALIYQPHTTSNRWTPVLVQQTKGGGSWQIGNYDTESLVFLYCTKANIDSQTNTVTKSIVFATDGISADSIANLPASKITSGTFSADRIPSLNASKINAGTFDAARIPSLNASKINAGTFDAARIPSLDAGKIGSGTLADARIPAGILRKTELVATEHSLKTDVNVTANSYVSFTAKVSKSGYYPLGVVGWRCANGNGSGSSYALPFILRIYSASSGSATVSVSLRAPGGAVNNCTFYATILWRKE